MFTNSSLMTCKPPFHIVATSGSHRTGAVIYELTTGLSIGGDTASIANCRSRSEISSPAILCGCRFGIGSLAELKLGDVGVLGSISLVEGGMMPGGGGPSHGAGWQSALRSWPSPHPMSTTCRSLLLLLEKVYWREDGHRLCPPAA